MKPLTALVIGGTRNIGPPLVQSLLEDGYRVTMLNRGVTKAVIPEGVERWQADRSDEVQLHAMLAGRDFELVVDTTLYNGKDAAAAARLLHGRVGRYIFLSTGQVYLVRNDLEPPFLETDYDGPVMAKPDAAHPDHEEWEYGAQKRDAEDAMLHACESSGFPSIALRLPMINSELDHHDRIYGYWLRLRDGKPIVIPEGAGLALRHVYGGDVIQAIRRAARSGVPGRAYNISQEETFTVDEFLTMLAKTAGLPLHIKRVPREKLESAGLLPKCSPFSGRWMSNLDNERSKKELAMAYTPAAEYVERLVKWHASRPLREIPGYEQRPRELEIS